MEEMSLYLCQRWRYGYLRVPSWVCVEYSRYSRLPQGFMLSFG